MRRPKSTCRSCSTTCGSLQRRASVLSVIIGGGKWVEIKIHADPLYQHLIVTAERKFWRCVESGEPPALFGVEPPKPRIAAVRIVDMSSSNVQRSKVPDRQPCGGFGQGPGGTGRSGEVSVGDGPLGENRRAPSRPSAMPRCRAGLRSHATRLPASSISPPSWRMRPGNGSPRIGQSAPSARPPRMGAALTYALTQPSSSSPASPVRMTRRSRLRRRKTGGQARISPRGMAARASTVGTVARYDGQAARGANRLSELRPRLNSEIQDFNPASP